MRKTNPNLNLYGSENTWNELEVHPKSFVDNQPMSESEFKELHAETEVYIKIMTGKEAKN